MNCVRRLQQRYTPGEARAIYRLLMEKRFGLSHTQLLLGKDTELSANERDELEIIMQRLLRGEPVQYVLGEADFCGRTFHVGPGVLIPRPETEGLVEIIRKHPPTTLLDIGTGSGCIAVTLALEGFEVTAFDVSETALEVARGNAEALGAKVNFRHEDILHPSVTEEQWQIIVSNPPYVCRHEAEEMEAHVLDYEPAEALFVPDDDPLLFYRAILDYAREHLSGRGLLIFETNRAYSGHVENLMCRHGYIETAVVKDVFGNDRIVKGRKP